MSSAAPTPVVVDLAADLDDEAVVAAVAKAINPISDVRCPKEYREFMVATYTRRQVQLGPVDGDLITGVVIHNVALAEGATFRSGTVFSVQKLAA